MKTNKIIILSLILFFALGAIYFENLGNVKSYFNKKPQEAKIPDANSEIIDTAKINSTIEASIQQPSTAPAPIIIKRDYSNLISKVSELDIAIIRNDFASISNLLKLLEQDKDLDFIRFDKSDLKNAIIKIEFTETNNSKLEKFNNFFGNMIKIKYMPKKSREEFILLVSDISIKIKRALEDEQTK